MQLHISDPNANEFIKQFGITQERADELAYQMNLMSKRLLGHVVRVCDVFNEIASFCETTEELVFCTISHTNYMSVTYGHIYCPPKKVNNRLN